MATTTAAPAAGAEEKELLNDAKGHPLHRAGSRKKEKVEYDKWPKDHPYAYTIGDVEIRDAPDLKTGKMTPLIFALSKWPAARQDNLKPEQKPDDKGKKDKKKKKKKEPNPVRKVFVSFKVKRVSDVDNVAEEFRIKFHMYFNWVPTYWEYMNYLKTRDDDADKIYEWEPRWYPHLEFMNQIEAIAPFPRWEAYPDEGRFRLQKLKGFFDTVCDDHCLYDPADRNIPIHDREPLPDMFDADNCYFLRAKYDVEMVLSEELELQSFPFDCQDLSVVMRENTRDMNISFLPEMRKKEFGSIDPRYSVIDEWDLESARIEFGDSNAGSSRSQTTYPMIIVRLKVKRRWRVFMWNIVFLMLCIECLACTAFALEPIEEGADRLGLSITLVLTAVAFLHIVKSGLPKLPYITFLDFYVYTGYLFLMAIMMETAALAGLGKGRDFDQDYLDRLTQFDNGFMILCLLYQFTYHVIFFFVAVYVRKKEALKLVLDSDSIEEEVNLSRPALEFDFREGDRQGDDKRLLYFKAFQRPPTTGGA